MRLMLADMENKRMDTRYKQGLHRWEPWKVMISAVAAAGALLGVGVALGKLF